MSRSRRHSHMRVARRRALQKAEVPHLVPCPKCKTLRPAHHLCPNCGTYGGRQVLPLEEGGRRAS
ncbi:MAG: 50S ribosomal protein L32 [Armatimonadota bacterium]|nr:50S ribosomal protein L32 [Armatimonadota bacterium]MDW8155123.1 50S ribosomal protein L32 [Armatimonadota bacterium]